MLAMANEGAGGRGPGSKHANIIGKSPPALIHIVLAVKIVASIEGVK